MDSVLPNRCPRCAGSVDVGMAGPRLAFCRACRLWFTAGGRMLRVSVREGTDPATAPLLLLNGIGASLEVLQPFVDALHPRRTVIRFDVPGVGGSPRPCRWALAAVHESGSC